MRATDIPKKVPSAFAAAQVGGSLFNQIPATTSTAGDASWVDGFTAVNDTPLGSGGVPPRIQDFNGLFYRLSGIDQWEQAGGPWPYDASFQTAIGGYPIGCKIASATFGNVWISTVDDNMTNPDTGGAGWISWRATTQPCSVQSAQGVTIGSGFNNTISANIIVPSPGWVFATGGINLGGVLSNGVISASLLIAGTVVSADQTKDSQFHQGYFYFSAPTVAAVALTIVGSGSFSPSTTTATYRAAAHFIPQI